MQCRSGIYPTFIFCDAFANNLKVFVCNKYRAAKHLGNIAGWFAEINFVNIKEFLKRCFYRA